DCTRITILLASNAIGTDKLQPLVIGSKTLNKKFCLENHQILLLIDGAACHFDPNKTTANILSNAQDTSDDEESTNQQDSARSNKRARSSLGKCGKTCKSRKTSILSSVSANEIENDVYQESIKQEENQVDNLVYDFTIQNMDLFVEQDFKKFLKINNRYVSTNEKLDDEQIVKIILEQNEQEQDDPDDTDKESVQVSILEGLNGLKTFIAFFEQQINVLILILMI
ncbi:18377_t:CDS:2, partial [Racocetra fulgida]